MEPEKAMNHQGIVEKEKRSWGHHVARYQAILQSCDHKDSMVLAQKQTHRPMEQNREPRNGPSALWSTNLRQSSKEYPVGEKKPVLQQTVLGKLDSHMQKNETGLFPYTIHKNRLFFPLGILSCFVKD